MASPFYVEIYRVIHILISKGLDNTLSGGEYKRVTNNIKNMGLDMYLARNHYVKNWEHDKVNRYSVIVKKNGKDITIDPDKVSEVVEDVAYWRKANAIHKWFVDHVQDGNDDCKKYDVTKEQLQELLDTCKKVLAGSELVDGKIVSHYTYDEKGEKKYEYVDGKVMKDSAAAEDLLPTTSGFFFGNTAYDESYIEDIKYTIDVLEKTLADKESNADYYYQSSW